MDKIMTAAIFIIVLASISATANTICKYDTTNNIRIIMAGK